MEGFSEFDRPNEFTPSHIVINGHKYFFSNGYKIYISKNGVLYLVLNQKKIKFSSLINGDTISIDGNIISPSQPYKKSKYIHHNNNSKLLNISNLVKNNKSPRPNPKLINPPFQSPSNQVKANLLKAKKSQSVPRKTKDKNLCGFKNCHQLPTRRINFKGYCARHFSTVILNLEKY